jgi:hypothetical protein
MTSKNDRHLWLRNALADKGLRAKDVASAWGVDDAVVSRFIKTGDPELTWPRAEALCRMLGIDMMQLQVKLSERLSARAAARMVPFAEAPPAAAAPAHEPMSRERSEHCDEIIQALTHLQAAVDQASRLLRLLRGANTSR